MLMLRASLLSALREHAQEEHPLEACGVLVGKEGDSRPTRLIAMRNAAQSIEAFSFDAREHLLVWRELEACGERVMGIYHSHTQSPAYPSRADVEYACDPTLHYVIVSTLPQADPAVRSFRVSQGVVVEENIRVVDKER